MSEKVSVIVSVHNVAPFVAKCIESIGNQEYQNLEIILIDDGSTDIWAKSVMSLRKRTIAFE